MTVLRCRMGLAVSSVTGKELAPSKGPHWIRLMSSTPSLLIHNKAAWPPTTGLLGTEGLTVKYKLPDGETLALDITTEFIVRDE